MIDIHNCSCSAQNTKAIVDFMGHPSVDIDPLAGFGGLEDPPG